jgi:hypothetical protein
LQKTFEGVDDVGLACIYFNYKEPTTPKEIIANVLKQLLERTLTLSDDFEKFYTAHQLRDTGPNLSELSELLRIESGRLSSVFILVDALDECPADENAGFRILSELHQILHMRFMITGRPHVVELMSRFESRILDIHTNDQDVKRALETQMMNPSFPKCLRDDEGLRENVIDTIMAKADRMYVIQTPAIRICDLIQKVSFSWTTSQTIGEAEDKKACPLSSRSITRGLGRNISCCARSHLKPFRKRRHWHEDFEMGHLCQKTSFSNRITACPCGRRNHQGH